MCEQILGYWVMMATRGGELRRWGREDGETAPFAAEDDALAFAAKVASESTCDSVYVMTVYNDGRLSMWAVCRPARDPSRPASDAGTITRW